MARVTLKIENAVESGGREYTEFLFRKPTNKDMWILWGRAPILQKAADKKSLVGGAVTSMQEARDVIDFCDKLLCRCSIAPKFIEESPAKLTAGHVPIEEIDSEARADLAAQLLKSGGFDQLVKQEEIDPLSKTSQA